VKGKGDHKGDSCHSDLAAQSDKHGLLEGSSEKKKFLKKEGLE
jgi:hypothetical protein